MRKEQNLFNFNCFKLQKKQTIIEMKMDKFEKIVKLMTHRMDKETQYDSVYIQIYVLNFLLSISEKSKFLN